MYVFYSETTPVYERPPEKYSATEIIRKLLNPNIDTTLICRQRLLNRAALILWI